MGRDRSSTPSLAPTKTRYRNPCKREYLGFLKKAEKQLFALQRDLQEQQQQYQEQNEKNLILTGLIYVQERTKAIYEKHKRWMAAGGPTAEELELQQQLEVELQVNGCYWCLYALETASWEQLQAAVSYDSTQWNDFLSKYFHKLVVLSELLKRSAEQQAELLQVDGVTPAPHLPLVYNFQGLTDTLTPAWAAVLQTLKEEGCLAILALLHGNKALYEAASKNAVTGQQCVPSPTYWAKLAERMRFTRLQKLHFKLALENHDRQARAAAAQGLSVLQETPSYAFLLACEAIAAQQQSPEGSPSWAGAPGPPPAAAAGVETGAANRHPTPTRSGSSSQLQQRGSPDAATSGEGSPMPASPTPPAAAAAVGDSPAAVAVAAALEGGGLDGDMAEGPGEVLQRKMELYLRQWVALNLFLKDTMSPEQNLIMSMGSYPFWPLPASICGAALQLPDNDSQATPASWQDASEVKLDSIELLLSQRRHTMAETHDALIPALLKLQL